MKDYFQIFARMGFLVLAVFSTTSLSALAETRHYYIAAEEID